ncbi:MAG: elongation factor G [Candidatus Stahlbacteria bacterium]|nr:elongation factor G [Candidatus Stahlbacteria bacterium]
MKIYEPKDIRNVVLIGHSASGKTTLADTIAFTTGTNSRQGRVDDGTSIFDYTAEEIERKMSIKLAIAGMEWKGALVNIIDTPGYDDFRGDLIASTRIADACIIVINSSTGIQPGTIKAKELATTLKLPIVIFVNQIAKSELNFGSLFVEIKKLFGKSVIPIFIPQGKEIMSVLETDTPYKNEAMEVLADVDDGLAEKFLSEQPFTKDEIEKGLNLGMKGGKLIPLYSGDAYLSIGVKELLDGLLFLPSPLERSEAKDAAFSAFTFKTLVDPHFGDLKFIRVFSGKLEPGTSVFNSTKKQEEKINQLYTVKGKEREETRLLATGMIGALVKLKNTQTADTLTIKESTIILSPSELPEPQVKVAILPKTKKDETKVSTGLAKLHEEDPTFNSFFDAETKQTIISGLGDLHINVILNKLKQNFGVEVELEKPKIHYRETITKMSEQQGKYKRQTGGHGQYGDCWIKFEPLERGKGFEFVDAIVGGKIPRRFIPSVEKGLKEAIEKGILANLPVTDFRATVFDGSYHDVDSSDIAFKIAASMAFKEGMQRANPSLIEPIMQIEVVVPSEYMGDVMGELSSRRGRIESTESVGNYQKIYATVPEAELYGFSTSIRSQTQGIGSFTQKFSRYEPVPRELQAKIIEEYKSKE